MSSLKTVSAAAALILGASASFGQSKSGAENSLVGIKLYDSGVRVVQVYGTPDQILPVGGGGGNIGPGGGGGGAGPTGGGGGPRGAQTGTGEMAPPPSGLINTPDFSFENDVLFRQGRPQAGTGEMSPPGSDGGKGGQLPTLGAAGGGGGGGGGAASGGSSGRVLFTRWVYKRGGSRYGFILDNMNRVVQIEAIGLQNKKVRTKKGVGFGATFADLIKRYQRPDGYEINGDQIVVRFLSRNHVAFRLSRLGVDKPHVVTGVVVAAGSAG